MFYDILFLFNSHSDFYFTFRVNITYISVYLSMYCEGVLDKMKLLVPSNLY